MTTHELYRWCFYWSKGSNYSVFSIMTMVPSGANVKQVCLQPIMKILAWGSSTVMQTYFMHSIDLGHSGTLTPTPWLRDMRSKRMGTVIELILFITQVLYLWLRCFVSPLVFMYTYVVLIYGNDWITHSVKYQTHNLLHSQYCLGHYLKSMVWVSP